MDVCSLVLPPGKLGLELEASASCGGLGLRVRGWNNPIFQLKSLPAGTIVRSIDGISVEKLEFSQAVGLLRESRKRCIEFYKLLNHEDHQLNGRSGSVTTTTTVLSSSYPELQQQNLEGSFADENVNILNTLNLSGVSDGKVSPDKHELNMSKSPLVDRGVEEGNNSFFKENKQKMLTISSPSSPSRRKSKRNVPSSPLTRSPLCNKQTMSSSVLLSPQAKTAHVLPMSAMKSAIKKFGPENRNCSLMVSSDSISTESTPVCVQSDSSTGTEKVIEEEALPPDTSATSSNPNSQQILDLKAGQRGADAKIMLLKYQMGKMKKQAIMLPTKTGTGSQGSWQLEALLIHQHKFCTVLDSIVQEKVLERGGGNLSAIFQPLNESGALNEICPRESRDVGLQYSFLAEDVEDAEDPADRRKLQIEVSRQERLIQRLKLQLRANVEAQINMHEVASCKEEEEEEAENRNVTPTPYSSLCHVSPVPKLAGAYSDKVLPKFVPASAAVIPVVVVECAVQAKEFLHEEEESSFHDKVEIENTTQSMPHDAIKAENSQFESASTLSCLVEQQEESDMTPDSPAFANVLQAIAINYASPMPYVQKVEPLQVISEEEEHVNSADNSTLGDILDTIEKTPNCSAVSTPIAIEKKPNIICSNTQEVGVAWTAWARNESKTVEMGLSPASFKDHLRRLRGANNLMRDDISRFRETLKRLSQ